MKHVLRYAAVTLKRSFKRYVDTFVNLPYPHRVAPAPICVLVCLWLGIVFVHVIYCVWCFFSVLVKLAAADLRKNFTRAFWFAKFCYCICIIHNHLAYIICFFHASKGYWHLSRIFVLFLKCSKLYEQIFCVVWLCKFTHKIRNSVNILIGVEKYVFSHCFCISNLLTYIST